MGVIEDLRKDILLLSDKLKCSTSIPERRLLSYDISYLNDLMNELTGESIEPPRHYMPERISLHESVIGDFEYHKYYADKIIGLFKKIDFYCYLRKPYVYLKEKYEEEIIRDFLSHYDEGIYKIYKELYDKNRIIINETDVLGASYMAPQISSYYVEVTSGIDSLERMVTLVHEASHIYESDMIKNLSWEIYERLNCGYFSETLSQFTELAFFDYLKKNNLFQKDLEFHQNLEDYLFLRRFKTLNYLYYALNNTEVYTDNNTYHLDKDSNFKLSIDENLPFFRYSDTSFREGDMIDFKYAYGLLVDYYFLREFRDNPKEALVNLKGFILENNNPRDIEKLDLLNLDSTYFKFVQKELLKRQLSLKEKYPIPGYQIKRP